MNLSCGRTSGSEVHFCAFRRIDIVLQHRIGYNGSRSKSGKRLGEVFRRRQVKRWRKNWIRAACRDRKRTCRTRFLHLFLALCLTAEGIWIGTEVLSVWQWETKRKAAEEQRENQVIRGLELELKDGQLRMFEIRQYPAEEE